MTGKIGKSHPHFQAKHRVSPQFLAGGGITSLGLRFLQCRLRRSQPVHRLNVLILTLIQRNRANSPRLPLSFRTTHNSKSTTRSSCSAFRRDLFQSRSSLKQQTCNYSMLSAVLTLRLDLPHISAGYVSCSLLTPASCSRGFPRREPCICPLS